jgi:hypothetical protein
LSLSQGVEFGADAFDVSFRTQLLVEGEGSQQTAARLSEVASGTVNSTKGVVCARLFVFLSDLDREA